MEFALSERRATYLINGQKIATIELRSGELPSPTPFIGLYGFSTSYKARNFRIRSLRPHVTTVQPIWQQPGNFQKLSAVCCLNAVTGLEICTLDADGAQLTLQALMEAVAAQLAIPVLLFGEGLENMQLVLAEGGLIPLEMLGFPAETLLRVEATKAQEN